MFCFFFSSRRRHTRWTGDWSSDVCSSDLPRADALEMRGTIRYYRFSKGLEPDAAAADKLLAAARRDLEDATQLHSQQAGAWNVLSSLYYQTRDLFEANRAARSA